MQASESLITPIFPRFVSTLEYFLFLKQQAVAPLPVSTIITATITDNVGDLPKSHYH